MTEKTFFIISNGSEDVYKDNTLTHFKNRLPEIIELPENENWVAAVESVGFSCSFKNVYLPDNNIHPSFMMSQCYKNLPEDEDIDTPCTALFEQEQCDVINFDFVNNEDGKNCVWKMFRFEDKIYTSEEMEEYFFRAQEGLYASLLHFDKQIGQFSVGATPGTFFWLIIHPSMIKTFGIPINPLRTGGEFWSRDRNNKYVLMKQNEYGTTKLVSLNVPLTTYYKSEKYYAYYIDSNQKAFFKSDPTNVFTNIEKRHPRLIRILCDNIKPQIFNSSFSQDLIVFCPDFEKIGKYYFHEFENKQYVSIANSILSDFEINIVDENNNKLQLFTGVPSIIKLSIKKMEEEAFNVRLTSSRTREYMLNKNSSFKVKLPNTLYLDRNWTVCLTYINHPNIFTTFHENENTRKILFRQNGVEQNYKLTLNQSVVFTKEMLIDEINKFLKQIGIGSAVLTENDHIKMIFNAKGILVISNYVLRLLGYTGNIDNSAMGTRIMIDTTNSSIQTFGNNFILEFKSSIDIDLLAPNYMIAYSNIVSSTIIGGSFNKILRIIPIFKSDDDYVIKEFHHKEYIELQNTEITEIEIELRAHDGTLVNFGSKKDVILNLEFKRRKKF